MKRHTIDSISFEFRQDSLNEPYVLFARFDGAVFICLVPFRLRMDAKAYIADAIDYFTGVTDLEGDWEMIWSDCPTFIEAQARMSFDSVATRNLDHLPM